MNDLRAVCIFAGARGKDYLFPDAEAIVDELSRRNCALYYGGSSKGVMGAVCRRAKLNGMNIVGVLPEKVAALKHYDPDVTTLTAPDMSSRKQIFWNGCDAFLCLPGAFGSMDELFEILTLTKLGYEDKRPIVIYDQGGFYKPLKDLFRNMVEHGLMDADRAGLVTFASTPWAAVDALFTEQE